MLCGVCGVKVFSIIFKKICRGSKNSGEVKKLKTNVIKVCKVRVSKCVIVKRCLCQR